MKKVFYSRRAFLNDFDVNSFPSVVLANIEYLDDRWWSIDFAITGCNSQVHLEFPIDSEDDARNSIAKAGLLAEVFTDFKEALKEAERFYREQEAERKKEEGE